MRRISICLIVLSLFIAGCSSKSDSQISKDYQNAIQAYGDGDFEKAIELLKNTQHYKKSEDYRKSSKLMLSVQGTYEVAPTQSFTIKGFDVEHWYVNNNDVKTTASPYGGSKIKIQSDNDADPSYLTLIEENGITYLETETGGRFRKK